MRLAHNPDGINSLRTPTLEEPLRVLVSGCLQGWRCGVDGTDNGLGNALGGLLVLPTVKSIPFCPEESTLGVPRGMPDIHGGDGFDVLEGRARVLDEKGEDLTERMILGAQRMLAVAREHRAELAILTDMSAACGSQVISDGCRFADHRKYQRGVGVATATLLRHEIAVVSQRDFRTLGRLRAMLDPQHQPGPAAIDHHETEWYRTYFSNRGA